MRGTHKIIATFWMAICGYFFATRVQGIYEVRPDRPDTLGIDLFFVLLFLGGAVTGFYVFIGASRGQTVESSAVCG
jgi:hypothetical protein